MSILAWLTHVPLSIWDLAERLSKISLLSTCLSPCVLLLDRLECAQDYMCSSRCTTWKLSLELLSRGFILRDFCCRQNLVSIRFQSMPSLSCCFSHSRSFTITCDHWPPWTHSDLQRYKLEFAKNPGSPIQAH